jgi:hypothetical protein
MRRIALWGVLGLSLLFGSVSIFFAATEAAGDIHPDFQKTWERTDHPIASGETTRTWMWGPDGFTDAFLEPYEDSPGGLRLVQYFDKTRMEITSPDGDPDDPWYVTNGLLARELITGELQLGDSSFEARAPANVQIAGDAHPDSPTYATFAALLDADSTPVGDLITQTISGSGVIGTDSSLDVYQVAAEHHVIETGHAVASPFWSFMNSSGVVRVDGQSHQDDLFENPFFGVGLPITGAYWVHVPIDGNWQNVLVQCFERRCLTYTPSNPDGWKVEAGNIGQHYYEWRYEAASEEPEEQDPPVQIPAEEELGPPVPGACSTDNQAILSQVSDSLDNTNPNSWAQGTGGDWSAGFDSSPTVEVGQELTFSIVATGDCAPIEYRVQRYRPDREVEIIHHWNETSEFSYTFESDDVGDYLMFIVDVRNQDPRYHFDDRDDYTYLTYVVVE